MHRQLQQRVLARARPDRLDRGHDRAGHRPLHHPLHHLRRLHQEEEESRKEILHHGDNTFYIIIIVLSFVTIQCEMELGFLRCYLLH